VKIRLLVAAVLALLVSLSAFGQTQVDLGNGFKPWGSYDGSSLDSVGLENGNLILHAPVIPKYPQRGSLAPEVTLYLSSHNWEASCLSEDPLSGTPTGCSWAHGGTGIWFELVGGGLSVQRTVERTSDPLGGFDYFVGGGYVLTTWDGASHQLYDLSGGNLSSFVTMDGTGYQVTVSNPDTYGVPQDVTVINRNGEQRIGTFGGARCSDPQWFAPRPAGGYARVYDQWQSSATVCVEHSLIQKVVDHNGNTISFQAPLISATPPIDTAGRPSWPLQGGTLGDSSNCINTLPFAQSVVYTYTGANGAQNQIKVCMGAPTLQTFFNLGGTTEYQNTPPGSQAQTPIITSIILPDGTYWSFSYDNYGNVVSIHLPTGGTITYAWTMLYPGITTPCAMAYSGLPIPAARAISQRTLIDNNGHSLIWNYHWGGLAADRSMTNWVTDPNGNDTVHVFKAVASSQCYYGGGSPGFHETQTKYFQGTKDSGTLLKQVDTSYGRATMKPGNNGLSFEADVFPTDIQTTLYPSGKTSLVHKDYDYAFGANVPSAGAVTAEKVYDWGNGGAGALLRETDTTYQWHVNAAYLSAGMLDLPATVVVKDGSGNRVAETDYSYDEPGYLQSYAGTLPAGTHGAAPNSVRGNQTTINRWLNTSNTFVPSHITWYDTGEVYQSSDPLGHTTTYSYDPQFGTFPTQTCSPATAGGAVTHCVSGSYDPMIGLLTSFTDQNQQTTSYSYDSLTSRITTALAPPDPANSNIRALTQFNYSQPNVFPMTVQVSRPVTTALTDSVTSTYDGLGRVFKTEHAMPSGPASTVVTTHDETQAQLNVTNPYFTTSDSTYGSTTDFFDALGRTTQIMEQDASTRTSHFSVVTGVNDLVPETTTLGDCSDSIDEAGKQRRSCTDALGRLVEVDEQNPGAGIVAATGSVIISGSEQSATSQPAIAASITITIGGSNSNNIFENCTPTCRSGSLPDTGQIGFGVNVGGTTVGSSVSYNNTYNPATLAAALYQNFSANAWVTMSNPNGTASFTLTATSAGTAQNSYVLTAMVTTSCMDSDTMSCAGPGWTMTLSGPGLASTTVSPKNFTGGQNASTTPDSGRITVTVNDTAYWADYGATDDVTSIARNLAGSISGGAWATASASGGTITLTSKTSGGLGNYSLAASYTWNSGVFVHPSFTTAVSGSRLAGGYGASDLDNHPFKTLYFYDALGNLLCVEHHGNVTGTGCSALPASDASSPWRVRRFTYDSLSRLLTAHNPESGAISYSYDADGNLLQKTSPAPNQTGTATQTISYCYDQLHRVTGKAYSTQSCPLASPVVTYTYDSGANARGKLTGVTDQAGSASYSYDVLGRLSSETRVNAGVSKSLSYDYNLDGSLKTLHYPSGRTVTYTPDSAGRIVSAADGNGTQYVSSATYYASGAEYQRNMPGIYFRNDLNPRLQVSGFYSNNGQVGQSFLDKSYNYGALHQDNGDVISIINNKDSSRTQSFAYDALNRITSGSSAAATGALSWGENYSIDPWGNLMKWQGAWGKFPARWQCQQSGVRTRL
jgi:YD repeat-containing protein